MEKDNQDETTSLCKKQIRKELPWYFAVFILLNVLIESTSLNLPYMFSKSGGITVTVSLQLIIFPFLVGTTITLVICARAKKCDSYQEVIRKYIGSKFSHVTSVFIALYVLGAAVSYFVAIADECQKVVQAIQSDMTEPHPWYFNRMFLISITSICIMLPLSLFQRIDSLTFPSTLAMVAYLYCVLLVIVKYFTGVKGKVGKVVTEPPTFYDTISAIPNMAVLFDAHLQILLLYGNRENATLDYVKTILTTFVICFTFYNSIGIMGYITFGDCVHPNILMSYYPSPELLIATVGVAIKLALAYPILSIVARNVTYSLMECVMNTDYESIEGSREIKVRVLVTLLWFFSSLALSFMFKDIDKITVVIGGLMAILSLIFPGISFLVYSTTQLIEAQKWKRNICITFAVLSIILGTFISILSITEKIVRILYPVPHCNG